MIAANLLSWLVVGLCLALSFLLSGMEAGVFALSRLRVRQQMRQGRRSARLLYGFLENPENFLWTIMVGNTIVNFLILGWIIPLLHAAYGTRLFLFIAVLAVIVFLFYVFLDLLPKMLFQKFPNRLCMFFARPFRFIHLALRPLVVLVERSSAVLLRWTGGKAFTGHLFGNREELRQLMQESSQTLSSEERTMINRVLDLQTLTVRQTTIPMTQVLMVGVYTPVREVLALAREHNLARFPVWEVRGNQQRVIGLVAVRTLLYQQNMEPEKPVRDYLHPALYVDEDMRLEVALRRMRRSGERLAVVLGRDGHEVGILSLGDILKTIFGEVKL